MEALPLNMNWKGFSDFASAQFSWFAVTLDDFFPDMKKEDEPLTYRRIDHLLSDMEIDNKSGKITINIQEGDSFVSDIESILSTMNSIIRKKYDAFFVTKKVNYI